jgi:hypothetical protein
VVSLALSKNKELTPADKLLLEELEKKRTARDTTGVVRNRMLVKQQREEAMVQIAELAAIYQDPRRRDERIRKQKSNEELGDFILRPGQEPIKFNKGDLVMGGTQLGMGGGKVEQLLEELLAETKAGKVIKMDAGAVGRSLQLNASKMSY